MPVYHPGVNHGHTASGRWADVQAAPNSSFALNQLCPRMTPRELVGTAMLVKFRDKPIALAHLNWYLFGGRGADFVEDANIELMLRSDRTIQAAIARRLPPGMTRGKFAGFFKVEQTGPDGYENQDLRFAFGAIDQLDFEADFDAGTLTAWFQDRYEWHPFYPGLYTAFPDDGARETNCLHAALVELKTTGAADYWMKGEATVPLAPFIASATARSSSSSSWL